MKPWSQRARAVYQRTYARPKQNGKFETWEETIERALEHNCSLGPATVPEWEKNHLRTILLERKGALAGRTYWMGGTDKAKEFQASQFNCSFLKLGTPQDYREMFHLLLLGCGVGFKCIKGSLYGYITWYPEEDIQTITVEDSAEGWSLALKQLLEARHPPRIDYSKIRPAGGRLKGFGWLCQGSKLLEQAFIEIQSIRVKAGPRSLNEIEMMDIANLIGTTLSSRRSAQICLMDYYNPMIEEFIRAKDKYWEKTPWRSQSNNSILFWQQPSRGELKRLFTVMLECGGSEPGIVNAAGAKAKAPWFEGLNPCAEILLPDKGFCNLVEVNLAAHKTEKDLLQTVDVLAPANYRQTFVDLDDGILSSKWNENNQKLRLCGVSLTGIAVSNIKLSNEFRLWLAGGCPDSAAITTIKPSGTMSKIMDTTEGIHTPLGRYIFNNVLFSKHDLAVAEFQAAGYRVVEHPRDDSSVLVTFPVDWGDNIPEVVNEPATVQLDRYLWWNNNWADHNVSVTISYSPDEVDEIVDWISTNWDKGYIACSFVLKFDATVNPKDIGHDYLPQQVVTKEMYDEYKEEIKDIALSGSEETVDAEECVGGVCPIR